MKNLNQTNDIETRANIVIKSSENKQFIHDYPEINAYIKQVFPSIDVSNIPIYIGTPAAFAKAKWESIGGCYIPHLSIILVKQQNSTRKQKFKGKFQECMAQYSLKGDTIDILIHEMIHAVSHKSNRSSQRYRHMEEEFVYTNCIDFYKQKGRTEKEIINDIFLPFCMQDVINNKKEIDSILFKLFPDDLYVKHFIENCDRTWVLNNYSEKISAAVADKARLKGKHMVDLYRRYGHGVKLSSGAGNGKSTRFTTIRLDSEI